MPHHQLRVHKVRQFQLKLTPRPILIPNLRAPWVSSAVALAMAVAVAVVLAAALMLSMVMAVVLMQALVLAVPRNTLTVRTVSRATISPVALELQSAGHSISTSTESLLTSASELALANSVRFFLRTAMVRTLQ